MIKKIFQKINDNISSGNQRLLLIVSIIVSIVLGFKVSYIKTTNSYSNPTYELADGVVLMIPLLFILFWGVILIILWVNDGYKKK